MNEYPTGCTLVEFLETVKDHQLTIVKDDGVYRHLQMRNSTEKWIYWYDIITFPGYLVYSGDMGDYVFRRTHDMFDFFRSPELVINVPYWAEKVQAEDTNHKVKRFSIDEFQARVKEYIYNYFEDKYENFDSIPEEILNEFYSVLQVGDEWEAVTELRNFSSYKYPNFNFNDFWGWHCEEYSYHFIWALYAICFAINKYDEKQIVNILEEIKA